MNTALSITQRKPRSQQPVCAMPSAWCGAICQNAMNQICVEGCAIRRDCSAFAPRQDLRLADMPKFPATVGMTREEKFTVVSFYLEKVVDVLQGIG